MSSEPEWRRCVSRFDERAWRTLSAIMPSSHLDPRSASESLHAKNLGLSPSWRAPSLLLLSFQDAEHGHPVSSSSPPSRDTSLDALHCPGPDTRHKATRKRALSTTHLPMTLAGSLLSRMGSPPTGVPPPGERRQSPWSVSCLSVESAHGRRTQSLYAPINTVGRTHVRDGRHIPFDP